MASLGISRASSHRQKSLKFAKKLSPSSSATGSKGGNGSSLTSSSASGLFDEQGLFVMKGMCDSGKLANLLFGLAFSVVLLLLFASLGTKGWCWFRGLRSLSFTRAWLVPHVL